MHHITSLCIRIQNTFSRQSRITKFVFKCLLLMFVVSNLLCIINHSGESFETSTLIDEFNYTNDVSCYFLEENDALPAAEERDFSPLAKSIFFHETSCKGGLNSRQACAVESAARKNPKWQINILFTGPVSKDSLNKNALKMLRSFENVKISRVHLDEYAKGTILEDIVTSKTFKKYKLEIIDILKYLTLFKWGGVYMDLDFVVMKGFSLLERNWVAREDNGNISDEIMCLSRDRIGRQIAKLALRELHAELEDREKSRNIQTSNERSITRALQQTCRYADLTAVSTQSCNGVEIYGPQYFFPVPYSKWADYFKPKSILTINADRYSHHFSNKLSRNMMVPTNSIYASLAEIYCPTIYELYGSRFGR